MSPWLRPEEWLPRRQIIRRWTENETDAQFVADRVRPMLHAGRYVEQVPGAGLKLGGDSFLLAPDLYDHAAPDDEFDFLVVMMGPLLRREIARILRVKTDAYDFSAFCLPISQTRRWRSASVPDSRPMMSARRKSR